MLTKYLGGISYLAGMNVAAVIEDVLVVGEQDFQANTRVLSNSVADVSELDYMNSGTVFAGDTKADGLSKNQTL